MKKSILFFTAVLTFNFQLLTFNCTAQLRGINYQAVAIDENGIEIVGMDINGQALNNKTIGVRFSILSGSSGGSVLYQETHATNTDPYGLFSLIIGDGDVTTLGQYQFLIDIPWSAANQFLKVEIDITNTGSYRLMSIQQFMAVPYTFYALKSDTALYSFNDVADANWKLTGNDSTIAGTNFIGTTDSADLVFKTNNLEKMRITADGYVGIGTANPETLLEINDTTNTCTEKLVIRRTGAGDVGLSFQQGGVSAFGIIHRAGVFGGLDFVDNYSGCNGTGPSIMRILGGGNVGIGTIAPTEKLDVSGNVKVSGLAGTGTRMVQADLNGILLPLAADSADKVLLGTGVWGSVPTSTAWSLLGNTGTSDSLNFIGTLDANPFNIRVNNQKSGRIDHISRNTFWGYRSGTDNTIGTGNTANGAFALDYNTTGIKNAAFGYYALTMSTTGDYNTAIGADALFNNTTGTSNTAVGEYSLSDNTSGNFNTSIGSGTLYSSTVGNYNTASGTNALYFNLTGSYNSAEGANALYSVTTGNNNVGLGPFAGYNNSTGSGNVFLGFNAGYNETGSNKLYIANDTSNPPLIYGDFSTGNVGIGTTNAGARLDVNGNTRISGNLDVNGTNGVFIPFGWVRALGFADSYLMGNVGIGTTSPAAQLDISDDGIPTKLILRRSGPGNIGISLQQNGFTAFGIVARSDFNRGLAFVDNYGEGTGEGGGIDLMRITWEGNVGIGTSSPAEMLEVAGNTRVGGLAGSGTRIVQTDLNGTLISLVAGSSDQVLLGTGVWGSVPAKTAWSLLGNDSTIDGTNFIGTTDNKPLNIRVNNQKAGRIDPFFYNTFWGYKAGNANINGTYSTANGAYALTYNTTGDFNTAAGAYALSDNSTGDINTANGAYALSDNTTGDMNTANGAYALSNNINGDFNTANGAYALFSNISGTENTAFGLNALYTSTAGSGNTALGNMSLHLNETGNYNTGVGYKALYKTKADSNTAIGAYALYSNITGFNNTGTGYSALYANTTGKFNTANGVNALSSNYSGNANTASGNSSLRYNTSGNSNTAYGVLALYNNTSGSSNTVNGYQALYSNVAGSNATAIGFNAMQFTNNTATAFDNYNVAVGFEALKGSSSPALNTGNYNTSVGYQTLKSNSAGSYNTANGSGALYNNTIGSYNTASGTAALAKNTTGSFNTAIGAGTLDSNTVGQYNTAIGIGALLSNTIGTENTATGGGALYSNTSGQYNTATGNGALYSSTTASDNSAYGQSALKENITGYKNTAFGENALYYNTTGNQNTAGGMNALENNINGTNNTALGYNAFNSGTAFSNSTAIGYNAQVTASNTIQLGNTSITAVKTSGTLTANGYITSFSTKTINYTLTPTDDIVSVTGTTTITLPTAAGITGRKYTIKNIDAAATVSINAGGAETIDGSPTKLLTIQYQYITVVSNGSNWLIVANN